MYKYVRVIHFLASPLVRSSITLQQTFKLQNHPQIPRIPYYPVPPRDNGVVYICPDLLKLQVEVEEKSSSCSLRGLRLKSQLFLLFFPHSTSESALQFLAPYLPLHTPYGNRRQEGHLPDDDHARRQAEPITTSTALEIWWR